MDNAGKILYHSISYHHSVHVLESFELVTLSFLYSEYNSFGQLFFPYIPGINTAVQTWRDDEKWADLAKSKVHFTKISGNVPKKLEEIHATAKSLQSCLTLCDPIDSSPPGSPVPGILQASTLEWVAISFSNAWKWKVKVKSWSHSVTSDSSQPHGL